MKQEIVCLCRVFRIPLRFYQYRTERRRSGRLSKRQQGRHKGKHYAKGTGFDQQKVVCTRFNVEWLTDGKDSLEPK